MTENIKKTVLLIAICITTLLILIGAIKINENRTNNLNSVSKISNYLTELKYEEMTEHLTENPNAIIYVVNSSEKESKEFDNIFYAVVKKYNLENEITFININETNIVDPYLQYAPELVFYEDGSVKDIVNCSSLKNKKDIIKILEERGVLND